ncbi:MAG: Phosphatase NudJ [Pseudomonadota bacterium]|jgi:ADP-ribose pyrophosphatase YjhB (NUDIX family)
MDARWKPNLTVAAIIEKDGKFLLVEEHTSAGLMLNNPAGHLDAGESVADACTRETLEETTRAFEPTDLVGIYLTRTHRPARLDGGAAQDITYLRFAFCGNIGDEQCTRQLDHGIVRTLWMTPDEIRASAGRHRSPLVLRCMEDYLSGQRFPMSLLHTDISVSP